MGNSRYDDTMTASLIEVTAGRAQGDVVGSWDKDTAAVIAEAVKNVPSAPVIDLT